MYTVRLPPEDEPHSRLYDYDLTDHLIVAQEWFHGVIFLNLIGQYLEPPKY